MGLVIADAEVQRLAEELARRDGKPVEEVVRGALERELARRDDIEELIRQGQEVARLMGPDGLTSDHSDLYDQDGLPA